MDGITDRETNTLALRGLEELFYSCAVVLCQFLALVGNRFWFTYSCTWSTIQLWGCVSFLVLAGNCFWCYVHTYLVYNTVVLLCQFLVVAGNSSQNENMFLR